MNGRKHQPIPVRRYLEIHNTAMQRFVDGPFVISDATEFYAIGNGWLVLQGSIECEGGVFVDVAKALWMEGEGSNPFVETIWYRYHVGVRGQWSAFRYDGPHPDHHMFHHRHEYDWATRPPTESVSEIADDEWPTLAEVIEEAETWYYRHLSQTGDVQ